MFQRLSRIVPLFIELLVFGFIIVGCHEQGHMIVANTLGVPGHVTFEVMGGFFHYEQYELVRPWQDALIGLGGGGLVALMLGILALCLAWQGKWERGNLDEAAICIFLAIFQLIYASYETFQIWAGWFRDWSQLLGVLVGLAIPILIFGRRIIKWWEEDAGLPAPLLAKKIMTLGRM